MHNEELLNEFLHIFKAYSPDWEKIINTNQFPEKYSDDDMYEFKLKSFGKAMKNFRVNYPSGYKTLRQFAELVLFSHTYINRIENNDISKLTASSLEQIALNFNSSVAYLIGLIDKEHFKPSRIDEYFWGNPNSKYKAIEAEIREALPNEKGLGYLIQLVDVISLDELKERIVKLIGDNEELAYSIYGLLSKPSKKRYNIIKILEYLNKI